MMKRKDLENDSVIVRPDPKSMKTDNSEKEKKYDRQLRLWGDHGQHSLENARVCLLGATATGTELLKSLVLPGIGGFTIIDDGIVEEKDLGCNFFLTTKCIGAAKAEAISLQLKELNGDCHCSWITSSPMNIIDHEPHVLRKFDVVISSRVDLDTLCKVSKFLWEYRIPHMICETYAFLGHLRVDIQEHVAIETHPDNALPDLRLHHPFPSLIEFMEGFNLNMISHEAHGHVPYLVIIYKALLAWQLESGKQWPSSYKEKSAIKDIIRNWVWKNDDGVPEIEENFEEALKNINNVLADTKLPSDVLSFLESSAQLNTKKHNLRFWIIAQAVDQSMKNNSSGQYPLRGSIPDMFCDSETFIRLQRCYKTKADLDAMEVKSIVQLLITNMGYPSDFISKEEIKLFCKNVPFIKVLQGQPFYVRFEPSHNGIDIGNVPDFDDGLERLHLITKAIYIFLKQYGKLPGVINADDGSDAEQLNDIIKDLEKNLGISILGNHEIAMEICRWKSSEVHSICAFLAGVAAQEVIKIVTKQYVPIDNTLLYNGLSQETVVMKL